MIEFTGKLEADDYVQAQYLNMRPRRTYLVFGLIVLAAITWAAWHTFFGGGATDRSATDFVFLAAIAYLIFFFFAWIPWRTRKTFKQQKSLQREIRMRFETSGISVKTELAEGDIPWSDIIKWKENDKLFLLYISDPLFHMIPKRLLPAPSDVAGVRDLLSEHIGRSAT